MVRRLLTATLVVIATTGGACGPDHIDNFGFVTSFSGDQVCFKHPRSEEECVDKKPSEKFKQGECMRLRLFPESSGTATLSIRPEEECEQAEPHPSLSGPSGD
jgi:hypothetical protein